MSLEMGYFVSKTKGKGSGAIREEVQILGLTAARFSFRQLLLKFFERCRRKKYFGRRKSE